MNPSQVFEQISEPTLLLDEAIACRNIQHMAQKAHSAGVRFRPHFKTHQSAQIGEWFRQAGVTCITVSSVEMAQYFAAHGWMDITIAFPVNLRQIRALNTLANQVHLGLLVESVDSIQALATGIQSPVDLWIKIDVGNHRTGLPWERPDAILPVIQAAQATPHLNLCGLLTHSGNTYGGGGTARILTTFRSGIESLDVLRQQMTRFGIHGLQVSVGDTPGCTLGSDFSLADEIRPGNFVFFDAMQAAQGVCDWEDIAVTLACPVVALHPERNIAILYGGAIHLNKDYFDQDGERCFGWIGLPTPQGWSAPLKGASLISLSQEHGIARLLPEQLFHIKVGDLVCVYPAHSCLAVSALGRYTTLQGEPITTFVRCA